MSLLFSFTDNCFDSDRDLRPDFPSGLSINPMDIPPLNVSRFNFAQTVRVFIEMRQMNVYYKDKGGG